MKRNYQRFGRFVLIFVILFTLIGSTFNVAYAKESQGAILAQTAADNENTFTFEKLGYTETVMVGPYDTTRIFFSLPPTWQLTTDATITVRLNFVNGVVGGDATSASGKWLGGTLRISFNKVDLETILLDQTGEITKTITIPTEALKPDPIDGRYRLTFFYDSSFNCNNKNINSSLIISSSSEIDLAHTIVPFLPDLSLLPRPIYQQYSIIQTPATIVTPDNPTAGELQAALAIAAGLGALTDGKLDHQLVAVSGLTNALKSTTNLIFVGLPSKLAPLQSVVLPVAFLGDNWTLTGFDPNDGLVMMAASPWNNSNVVLVASGESDAGVVKAAQAISTGKIVTSGQSDFSVISSVNPYDTDSLNAVDRTFGALGFGNQPLGGVEGSYTSLVFSASSEQVLSLDGYIDLVTSHTSLLDFEKSGLTVFLNGEVLGGVEFSSDSEQVMTTRLKLMPGLIHRGSNLLEIVSDLVPAYNCYSPDLSANTVVIGESSLIHLPVASQKIELGTFLNLQSYPAMFISNRNLSDLSFVVAPQSPISWDIASQVALYIGAKGAIPVANLRVFYGDAVPESARGSNMIVVGRASQLPIVNDFKDVMPAPFDMETDEAVQPAFLINYRLMPGISVGYLQLFSSPWNPEASVLAIMGNTDVGIPMAGGKLTQDDLVNALNGNFAILYGDQILTTDTRLGITKDGLIATVPGVVTTTPVPLATLQPASQPVQVEGRAAWILPVFGAITIVIVIMLLIVLRNVFAGRITSKQPASTESSDETPKIQ